MVLRMRMVPTLILVASYVLPRAAFAGRNTKYNIVLFITQFIARIDHPEPRRFENAATPNSSAGRCIISRRRHQQGIPLEVVCYVLSYVYTFDNCAGIA